MIIRSFLLAVSLFSATTLSAQASFDFLKQAEIAVSHTVLKELPASSKMRLAAYFGLGGRPFIGIDTQDEIEADRIVAFYLAGLSAHIYNSGDVLTHDRMKHRVSSLAAEIWASSFTLPQNIRTLSPASSLDLLFKLTDDANSAAFTRHGHRATALLALDRSPGELKVYFEKLFANIEDTEIGMLIALEYLVVFKRFDRHELFSQTFVRAQKSFDTDALWNDFLMTVDSVDLIFGGLAKPTDLEKNISTIKDWRWRLRVLTIGAQFGLERCHYSKRDWFIQRIHKWHNDTNNTLTPAIKLNSVIDALGEIEANFIGFTPIAPARCE